MCFSLAQYATAAGLRVCCGLFAKHTLRVVCKAHAAKPLVAGQGGRAATVWRVAEAGHQVKAEVEAVAQTAHRLAVCRAVARSAVAADHPERLGLDIDLVALFVCRAAEGPSPLEAKHRGGVQGGDTTLIMLAVSCVAQRVASLQVCRTPPAPSS